MTADRRLPYERRASRWIAAALTLSILAGVGLLALYAVGGQAQLEGVLLGVLLGGIGLALVLWGKHLFPTEIVTEERGAHESAIEELAATERSVEGQGELTRRTLLVRLLVGAAGALGLAAIFPIRSLGPGPGNALFHTAWRRGARLVDEEGMPVRADQLDLGGVVTVFPEGRTDAEDSQAILVRVDPAQLHLPDSRDAWAPVGNVCYSKICTHAGCPVGLYSAENHQLLCPCHASTFDVTDGGNPVFGPAARPLPQLPLFVDDQGYLRARGDFPDPVGPGFWNIGRKP